MKPTFIGIGAQKCASTWLYDVLADHPQVSLSDAKELDFFSNCFDYGFQWYERHFKPHPGAVAAGEVSPSYFHGLSAPSRVHAYNPDMRLIAFLREPFARALSNHKHEVRTGHLQGDDLSFEFGLENNPSYVEQGLYATHLSRWLEHFPREQLLIVLFDDVYSDGAAVARRVYEFLQIDGDHVSAALHERSNESYVNRSPVLETAKNSVRGVVRGVGLSSVWDRLGNTGLRGAYRSVNRAASDTVIPPPLPETRAHLAAVFEDELSRLEVLTGIDLSHWRSVPPARRSHG